MPFFSAKATAAAHLTTYRRMRAAQGWDGETKVCLYACMAGAEDPVRNGLTESIPVSILIWRRERNVTFRPLFVRTSPDHGAAFDISDRAFHYTTRAEGARDLLGVVDAKRCDERDAFKLLTKFMKRFGAPREIIADRLRSCTVALRELGGSDPQSTRRWSNSRAENTHPPFGDESGSCSGSGGAKSAAAPLNPQPVHSRATPLLTTQFQAQPHRRSLRVEQTQPRRCSRAGCVDAHIRPHPRQCMLLAILEALRDHRLQLFRVRMEIADAFGQLLGGHGVLVQLPAERGFI